MDFVAKQVFAIPSVLSHCVSPEKCNSKLTLLRVKISLFKLKKAKYHALLLFMHATAVTVARKEKWHRIAIWSRVHDFYSLTQLNISSPIISLIIGTKEAALSASRHILNSGFHVMAIRPPTVPPNSWRLRITLSAAHTSKDIRRLVAALSGWIQFPALEQNYQIASKI